jgi:hypothetical protein
MMKHYHSGWQAMTYVPPVSCYEILDDTANQDTQKHNTVSTIFLQHLQQYHDEGNAFLQNIAAGDETWCHH